MQHVVAARISARGLYAHDVMRLFYHTDHAPVAVRIPAELAKLAIGNVVADGAQSQLVLNVEYGLRQVFGVVAAVLILVAMVASGLPALRARRVDPITALRDD